MQEQILKNFFPPHRINSFKKQINTFTQKAEGTLLQCWNRYKELLNISPHHDFETWRLVSYYKGLTSQGRQVVEMMCNSEFRDKSHEVVLDYLDQFAKNAQHCNIVGFYKSSSKLQSSPFGGGMYNLREDHDF